MSTDEQQVALAIARSLEETGGKTWELPKTLNQDRAKQDMQRYRQRYPGQDTGNDKALFKNLLFYKNYIPFEPQGDLINQIHKTWWGDYEKMEKHHGYIQWLFPLREKGGNQHSQVLQVHELEYIARDPEARARVFKSYAMFLEFCGMRVKKGCEETGELERHENWRARYKELNVAFNHNFLRITRMLKSLGELGFEKVKKYFLVFVLGEIYGGMLEHAKDAAINYWVFTLRDDNELKELQEMINVWEIAVK